MISSFSHWLGRSRNMSSPVRVKLLRSTSTSCLGSDPDRALLTLRLASSVRSDFGSASSTTETPATKSSSSGSSTESSARPSSSRSSLSSSCRSSVSKSSSSSRSIMSISSTSCSLFEVTSNCELVSSFPGSDWKGSVTLEPISACRSARVLSLAIIRACRRACLRLYSLSDGIGSCRRSSFLCTTSSLTPSPSKSPISILRDEVMLE
mmetsp:Transcript_19867/g.79242  ORF Transcript_19867/g.79242 Transcript_19867/m.79242 type:complete len:208 (-) Transcript_19867:897-1520(-)